MAAVATFGDFRAFGPPSCKSCIPAQVQLQRHSSLPSAQLQHPIADHPCHGVLLLAGGDSSFLRRSLTRWGLGVAAAALPGARRRRCRAVPTPWVSRSFRAAGQLGDSRTSRVRAGTVAQGASSEAGDPCSDTVDRDIQAGDTVEIIATDVKFYHVPKLRGVAYDAHGLKGVVVKQIEQENLTPNRPVLVKFQADSAGEPLKWPFTAHCGLDELRLCTADDPGADSPSPTAAVANSG